MREAAPWRFVSLAWVAMGLALALAGSAWAETGPAALEASSQVVLVLTSGWDDLHGTLQCFERGPSAWRALDLPVRAVVGRSGLGWGRGVVAVDGEAGPVKREGDGRGPAGAFRITGTFGFAPAGKAPLRMPYLQLQPWTEGVDDVRSKHYNEVLDTRGVPRDWSSAERMRRVSEYEWGAFVGHNIAPPLAGAGSCIFLHLWDGPDLGTAGCTALEKAPLLAMLKWLDPDKRPLLVQLPRPVYLRLRDLWKLP